MVSSLEHRSCGPELDPPIQPLRSAHKIKDKIKFTDEAYFIVWNDLNPADVKDEVVAEIASAEMCCNCPQLTWAPPLCLTSQPCGCCLSQTRLLVVSNVSANQRVYLINGNNQLNLAQPFGLNNKHSTGSSWVQCKPASSQNVAWL